MTKRPKDTHISDSASGGKGESMATESRKTGGTMEAIEFYNANATNFVNVPRTNHPEDPSGWDGVRRASEAGTIAKDALVMTLADACDFAEAYAKATK